ncbi:unnamed protein product [Allacma fusca]|uniref:Mitochondrial carrier protein n=1 Tax=Allacma fusca TaxID=39272 RepID=A0A8J2LUP8_9HEXA|nr:unnamed protein product [Allacma fusca]
MDLSCVENLAQKINLDLKTWGIQCGFIVAYHPLDYCKTLVQVGYEPFPPVESWFFGSTYLGLPNMFQYLRYLKSVDGFSGCYRGLTARLCGSTVSACVYNTLSKKVSISEDHTTDSDVPSFLKKTAVEIVCVTGSTIVAHPFHVIAVRTMAQFVGRETIYQSLWGSICEIYGKEGIKGFFSGVIPRLVGDIIYISISATIVYIACRHFGKSKLTDQAGSMTGNMVASSFSYPFQVVSNTIIVNNSGLAVGCAPHTRPFYNWVDAYRSLKYEKQLKRGSSLVGRAYTGPTYLVNGRPRPYGFYFGPVHLPGASYK